MRKYRIAASIAALVVAGSLVGAAVADSASATAAASGEGGQAAAAEVAASAASPESTVSAEAQSLGMEKLGNARQLGGYVGADGRTVKEGLLLRTAKLADATEADLAKLLDEYNLGYVCDFRTSSERASAPDPELEGVENVWCSIVDEDSEMGSVAASAGKDGTTSSLVGAAASEVGKQAAGEEQAVEETGAEPEQAAGEQDAAAQKKAALEATVKTLLGYAEVMDLPTMYDGTADSEHSQQGYRAFFDVLLNNEEGKAVLWHCTAGKDRAGLGAVLLLSALGVDRETILDDFALTNDFNAASIEALASFAEANGYTAEQVQVVRDLTGVNRSYMEHTLDHIDETYGSMHDYLVNQIGLSEDEIARLQEMYLEG